MSKALSRRDFLKGAAVGAASIATIGTFGACSVTADNPPAQTPGPEATASQPTVTEPVALPGKLTAEEFAASPVVYEPITAWDDEKTYDVVVVGAGSAGVCAALAANKDGASVAVLQKLTVANSQGSGPTGVNVEASDPQGVLALINAYLKDNDYRANRKHFEMYLKYSAPAIQLAIDAATEGADDAVPFVGRESDWTFGGYPMKQISLSFSPKPISNMEGVQLLSTVAEKRGVDYYYETPAVQLVKDGNKVVGIIGQTADNKYVRFNASKAVIMAAGDYQNNPFMVDKYCPDANEFDKKQFQKTGDGHLMMIMAGAMMEPIGHTKMIHDTDSGPMRNEPFLIVNENGVRFMDETTPYESKCNFMRDQPSPGKCTQVFDANYVEQVTAWGGNPTPVEALANFMPEKTDNPQNAYSALIDTHEADTLEDLAKKIGIPGDALVKAVADYNALCDSGIDSQFGKDSKFMQKLGTPPFYCIHKNYRVSAICSGVCVDEFCRVLDSNKEVIPGLYSAGNCAGLFYGAADYPFTMPGISIGRAYTQGYISAKHVMGKL